MGGNQQNKEYEDARKAYKQFLTPPPGTPSVWGPELQEHIEKGTFCPLTAMKQPSVDLGTYVAKGGYVKAKLAVVQLKHNAYPAKLLAEVPQCQLDMHVSRDVPDDRAVKNGSQACHAAPHVVPV